MKYCVIFESDQLDDLTTIQDGTPILVIETDIERVDIKGTIRRLPPKMPMNYYDFETYTTGYTKGFNDCLDRLEGKNGEYDEEEDRINVSN